MSNFIHGETFASCPVCEEMKMSKEFHKEDLGLCRACVNGGPKRPRCRHRGNLHSEATMWVGKSMCMRSEVRSIHYCTYESGPRKHQLAVAKFFRLPLTSPDIFYRQHTKRTEHIKSVLDSHNSVGVVSQKRIILNIADFEPQKTSPCSAFHFGTLVEPFVGSMAKYNSNTVCSHILKGTSLPGSISVPQAFIY